MTKPRRARPQCALCGAFMPRPQLELGAHWLQCRHCGANWEIAAMEQLKMETEDQLHIEGSTLMLTRTETGIRVYAISGNLIMEPLSGNAVQLTGGRDHRKAVRGPVEQRVRELEDELDTLRAQLAADARAEGARE